jgi:hypothetical protein
MKNKRCSCLFSILLLLCYVIPAFAADDWAFQLGDEAKEIYSKKKTQISCQQIDKLIDSNDNVGLYIAIRDAALFGDRTCKKYIDRNYKHLMNLVGVRDAVTFYKFKNGDSSALGLLAQTYDREVGVITGDHWVVDIFGFIEEWDVSGRRLVKRASSAQEVGSELLCSAIMWRRYLHGEKDFKDHWFQIGKEEKVSSKKLKYYYDTCHP